MGFLEQKQNFQLRKKPNTGCIRRWPSQDAKNWCIKFFNNALNLLDLDAIVAIGSSIREVPYSADVDLLIIYHSKKPALNNPPIDVDIHMYERSKIDTLISNGHELLVWAIQLGCLVIEQNSYWTNLSERWKNQAPFPSAEKAALSASRSKKIYMKLSLLGDEDAKFEEYITMLTHLARERLLRAGKFPYSRPELPGQLRLIGENSLSKEFEAALIKRSKLYGQKFVQLHN